MGAGGWKLAGPVRGGCFHRPLSLSNRELSSPNRPHMSPTAQRRASPRNLSFSLGGASEQGLPTTPLPSLEGGNARKKKHGPLVGPASENAGQNAGQKLPDKNGRPKMSAKTCRHEPAAVSSTRVPIGRVLGAGGCVGPRPSLPRSDHAWKLAGPPPPGGGVVSSNNECGWAPA